MIVHDFSPILVDLGFFQIRWYSIAYILGIIIGWVYATKIIKLTTINKYNFEQIKASQFDDLVIYLIIGIILGGRLGYVIFYNLEYTQIYQYRIKIMDNHLKKKIYLIIKLK